MHSRRAEEAFKAKVETAKTSIRYAVNTVLPARRQDAITDLLELLHSLMTEPAK